MQPISAHTLLNGLWPAAPAGLMISDVVTDSRKVAPGCLFVAIKGERADGHDFAAGALEHGAALVMGTREMPGVPPGRAVLVPDILDALIQMGGNYRSGFSPLVLGITGSVGKTTTKEFCHAVFSSFGPTLKTEGNQNNEIGLPGTLFRLTDETRYAVVEMGMQGLGEIRKLALAARPSGAIITKIGVTHIQHLGSVENILRAKLEIAEGVAPGGPLILNGDDEWLRGAVLPADLQVVWAGLENEANDVRVVNVREEDGGQRFEIIDRQYGRLEATIPAVGLHTAHDAALAYAAATRLGLNAQQVAAALAAYQPTGPRQRIERVGDITVIADYYNAGPDSVAAALKVLAGRPAGRRIAVLGNMMELGDVSEEAHREVGRAAARGKTDVLLTVGDLAALAAGEAGRLGVEARRFATNAEAAGALLALAKPGDVVLIKASRGMKFEEIYEAFTAGLRAGGD